MSTRVVDAPEIMELLERVVEREGPDTIRETMYVIDEQPHCIAANVLVELGMSVSALNRLEGASVHRLVRIPLDGIQLSSWGADVLWVAQECQDMVGPWGRALDEARKIYGAAQ